MFKPFFQLYAAARGKALYHMLEIHAYNSVLCAASL